MNAALAFLFAKLERNRRQPLGTMTKKAVRYACEAAAATIHLRSCDLVGHGVRVIGRPRVRNGGRIEIGDGVRLFSRWAPVEIAALGGEITIGSGSGINFGTLVSAMSLVTIGKRVMIGNYCVVADTFVPGVQVSSERHNPETQPITIGDDVWLAVRVTVLPGTTIGAGTVVAAGSVVSGSIPPGVIVAGSPARVLRESGIPPGGARTNGHTATNIAGITP